MTPFLCMDRCSADGWVFAGFEFSQECCESRNDIFFPFGTKSFQVWKPDSNDHQFRIRSVIWLAPITPTLLAEVPIVSDSLQKLIRTSEKQPPLSTYSPFWKQTAPHFWSPNLWFPVYIHKFTFPNISFVKNVYKAPNESLPKGVCQEATDVGYFSFYEMRQVARIFDRASGIDTEGKI